MLMLRLAAAVIALTGVTSSGFAADLTDEELLRLFQNQRDAFLAAQQSGTGQTRGLTLVTVDSVQATTLAPSLATPGQEDTATAVPTTDGGVTVMTEPSVPVEPLVDLAAKVDAAPAVVQPVVFGALAPELQINLNIRFPFDSATLTPDQKPVLTQMCKVMRASDIKLFRIVGHTDSTGSEEYNQRLSQLRAEEVQRYLVGGDCGIEPSRLEALGLGKQFLFDTENPKSAVNRRVEFQALS